MANPADPVAAPFGWHDTNGLAGAEYSITRGNSVYAYPDVNSDDLSDGGEPSGGPTLVFTPTWSAALDPAQGQNQAAALTNLFYLTNRVHDVLYHYGFDEAAGNFQQLNYTATGVDGDAVQAEAQDGGSLNNANFASPPDGQLPRMQMYLGGRPTYLTVNSPAAISGPKALATASFGPQSFTLTSNVVLVDDGVVASGGGTVNDGCETPFVNAAALVGKIALISRGLCTSTIKVKNAQNAGAIGVIVGNNAAGAPIALGGTDATIIIPALAITQADSNAIKARLAAATPVNVTLVRSGAQRDGALDNGVIAHEYGHGLSNRLTGGPSNAGCLNAPEEAGEGWSDFVALAFTAKPTDTATTQHAVGTWLYAQAPNALGIRRYPYTTDLAANPLTYKDVALNTEVHALGEVWTALLWEVYWNLVADEGFSADLVHGSAGNTKMFQLVIDGLKLQPCNPTFVQARDAILSADVADYGGVHQCRIWQGFAKRGLGHSASSGAANSATDGTQAFDLPPLCTLDLQPAAQQICAPNPAVFSVMLGPNLAGAVSLAVSGQPASTSTSFSPNPITRPQTSTLTIANTAQAAPGAYTIRVVGTGATTYTDTAQLVVSTAAPGMPVLTSPADAATNQPLRPTLTWTAPAQPGATYVVELAADPGFSDVIYINNQVVGTTMTLPRSLSASTTYYWRVSTSNGCGSGPVSPVFRFTVRATPSILLVDDDTNGLDMQPYYTTALNALGAAYDVWDDHDDDAQEPDLAALANYRTVIWFGGRGGRPSPASETAFAGFLDRGSCLVISAQEFFARHGNSAFMHQYLGLASAENDVLHTAVAPLAPFLTTGITYTLSFPPGEANFTDRFAPSASAAVAFRGDQGAVGLYKDAGSYRTLYAGFPLEALGASNLQTVLQSTLAWCAAVPQPTPTVTAGAATATPPTATATTTRTATSAATTAMPTATTAPATPTRTATSTAATTTSTAATTTSTATTIAPTSTALPSTATHTTTSTAPSATRTTTSTPATPTSTSIGTAVTALPTMTTPPTTATATSTTAPPTSTTAAATASPTTTGRSATATRTASSTATAPPATAISTTTATAMATATSILTATATKTATSIASTATATPSSPSFQQFLPLLLR